MVVLLDGMLDSSGAGHVEDGKGFTSRAGRISDKADSVRVWAGWQQLPIRFFLFLGRLKGVWIRDIIKPLYVGYSAPKNNLNEGQQMNTMLAILAAVASIYGALCLTEKKIVTIFNFLPLPPDRRRVDKLCRNFVFLASGGLWMLYPEMRMVVEVGWWLLAVWYLVVIADSEEVRASVFFSALTALSVGIAFCYTVVKPNTFAWLPLVLYVGSGCLVLLRRELKFAKLAMVQSGYDRTVDL